MNEYALKVCVMCRRELLGKVEGPIACTECLEKKKTVRELLRECINWHQDFIATWKHYSYLRRAGYEERKVKEPKKHIIQRHNIGEEELE